MAKRIFASALALVVMLGLVLTFIGCNSTDMSNHALVGTWAWTEGASYTYVFYADGTGSRGDTTGVARQHFVWSIPSDGRLYMRTNREDIVLGQRRDERWGYVIADDVLTITSRQEIGVRHSYSRVMPGETPPKATMPTTTPADVAILSNHALVGTWAWNDNVDYIYMFNTDGTGVRGGAGMSLQRFWWSIPGNGRVYMSIDHADVPPGGLPFEQWDYHITDNVLTLTSRQVANTSYSYTRVDG
ncbi:MAG: hypothetical protein FWD06_09215 [Oscillospiraceae bacterium]|nr:hypothetical protein [Oscillospiraceae bacterium]